MKESTIEENAMKAVEKKYPGTVHLKLNVMYRRHWPDRLIGLPGVPLFFIEFKKPDEQPTKAQAFIHRRLRKNGKRVDICTSVEEALAACAKMVKAHG